VLQVAALVVAEGEERLVHVEELLGELVAHHDAGLESEEAGVVTPAAPDVGLALGDVDLAEREGHEGDVPGGAGAQAGDHVLVGVAGEGAAVVPGDGEGAGGGAHTLWQRPRARRYSVRCGQGLGHTRRATAASP